MSNFDLTQSPFDVLSASVEATRHEIVGAHERALHDGRCDEAVLLRAQQRLLTPRTRLEDELAWLPGVAAGDAARLVAAATATQWSDAYHPPEVRHAGCGDIGGLARANLAADLCGRLTGTKSPILELVDAYGGIDEGDVADVLRGARERSALGPIDPALLRPALEALAVRHADAALACLQRLDHPGLAMTAVVEQALRLGGPAVLRFLDRLVRGYDAWSEPTLRRIQGEIEAWADGIRARPADSAAVPKLNRLLDEWDAYSQAVQLFEQHHHRDEPRSEEVHRTLRDVSIWLANEQSQHRTALAIAQALLRTFPELPSVARQLANDIETLKGLVGQARSAEALAPLIDAVEAVKSKLGTIGRKGGTDSFSIAGNGPLATIYSAFRDAADATRGTEDASLPWWIVRSLAIDLHNKAQNAEMALRILETLLRLASPPPPKDIAEQLRKDVETIAGNLRALSNATNGASGKGQLGGYVFWALLVIGIVVLIAYGQEDSRPQRAPAQASYSPPASSFAPSPAPSYRPAPVSPPVARPSPVPVETRPPAGVDRLLTGGQLRYCLFENARLDQVSPMVNDRSSLELERFNALVNDFNSRCASFRYYTDERQSVLRDVAAQAAQIRRDAERIVGQWRAAAAPAILSGSGGRALDLGQKSDAAVVQHRLAELGFYKGPIDGAWGPQSREALRSFNAAASLVPDTPWGARTQSLLFAGRKEP